MSKKLYLTILWHQHQPYYKDDVEGSFHMPWTYLHALKDYYEMARHVMEAEKVKVVFNLVPSLLVQLEEYSDPTVNDVFLNLVRRDVSTLNEEERRSVLEQCFMANAKNMIKPWKRYDELFVKKSSGKGEKSFEDQEILDLEVLYILSWCGEFMRREDERIRTLAEKGAGFTQEDKLVLLESAAIWIGKITDIHKKLASSNKAELSCTPYFHPILPLLTDITSAKEAYADIPMPDIDGNLSDDADWHLKEGLAEFERRFGARPYGMWPAEGSISQKTVDKYAANGVNWIASDEEVLANTLKRNLKDPSARMDLYKKWSQELNGRKINVFFRDKNLSDAIGFIYASWRAEDAVNDFMSHLRGIYDAADFSTHVSVILDGENAWEYYPRNAYDFFSRFYGALKNADWLETKTFHEICGETDIPENRLPEIVAGSWIMGNFKIWIGHREKNKAWELLSRTRRVLVSNAEKVDEKARKAAYKELHIAEGSDWFWWFGDDHFSAQSDVFDKLFRKHLINVYKILNITVPTELFRPIRVSQPSGSVKKPVGFVSPEIDGRVTSFYEWQGSGEFNLKSDAGSMHASGGSLKNLRYGRDRDYLYILLDTDLRETARAKLEIEIFTAKEGNSETYSFELESGEVKSVPPGSRAAARTAFEAALPFKKEWSASTALYSVFKLKIDGAATERAPLYNAAELDVSSVFDDEWII